MITKEIINQVLNISYQSDDGFTSLGLCNSIIPETLSFYDDQRFLKQLNENKNIKGVFVSKANANLISSEKVVLVVTDPRFSYYTLQNYVARKNKKDFYSVIDDSSKIHRTAYVAEKNVRIGKNCLIYPNATILEDVEIRDNCVVQSGAIIGSEGFEYKRTENGILPVYHDGIVRLGNFVEIGANSCVDKGFSFRDTIIGDYTKIDNLVHIGHCAHIGRECLIAACAQIGAVNMGDKVWVGPSVNLLSSQNIGDGAYITVGSLVTKDVLKDQRVTGYFAIPHEKFIENLKNK